MIFPCDGFDVVVTSRNWIADSELQLIYSDWRQTDFVAICLIWFIEIFFKHLDLKFFEFFFVHKVNSCNKLLIYQETEQSVQFSIAFTRYD